MKVYVVTEGEYSDYCIDAIFSDYKQAELYQMTHEETNTQIEEYELDLWKLEGEVKYGVRGHVTTQGYVFGCPVREDRESQEWQYDDGWFDAFIPTKKFVSEEQANKIARDDWARFKAEKEGV